MQLIDRHALLKNVYDNPPEKAAMTHAEWCRKCIYEAPAIEAEPVRHSEWLCVNKEESVWMCDNCGNEIEMKGTNPIKIGIDWCPYCGFRMDGGDDNGKSV